MARVLEVRNDSVRCELNSGKIVEYHKDLFGWDVLQGDEFSIKKAEDGTAYIEPSHLAVSRAIPLEDLDEDGDGVVSDQEISDAVAIASRSINRAICPNCGSFSVNIQTLQENYGSVTTTKTKTKSRRKGKGILWWLFIGWWFWVFDLCLWFFAFFPRLILKLFASGWKKDARVSEAKTIEKTANQIRYIKLFTCQNCGHTWRENVIKL